MILCSPCFVDNFRRSEECRGCCFFCRFTSRTSGQRISRFRNTSSPITRAQTNPEVSLPLRRGTRAAYTKRWLSSTASVRFPRETRTTATGEAHSRNKNGGERANAIGCFVLSPQKFETLADDGRNFWTKGSGQRAVMHPSS